jgi:HK97 family phage major capsid protein
MSQVLYDRRAQVWEAYKALLDATADRTLSGQEKEAETRMSGELDELDEAISTQEKGKQRAALYDAADEPQVSTRSADNAQARASHPLTPEGPAGTSAVRNAVRAANAGDFVQVADYERAFDAYLRRGTAQLNSEQRAVLDRYEARDLSVGTTTAGGYTVPPGFVQKITDALKLYGGMLQVSNVINTDSGQPLQWPTADDTGNVGAILAENNAATTLDVTFGQKTLGAYMYTSRIVKVSYQLLNDSAFDLGAWVPVKFAQRIGRALNAHFTNGTGGGTQPAGLVPNLTVGKVGAVGSTISLGAGGASNPAYGELIDLIHSVDPAYRESPAARFMMADSSVKIVRKILDTTGQPIWQPGLQAGQPSTILGYPVVINQDMPVMAINAKSIAFGDFNAAYVVRQVQGVQVKRFDERFADALQVGFLSFARYDGVVDDSNAAKLWQNSAT